MTDGIEGLMLEQFRLIRGDIATVKADTAELKQRVTSLQVWQANILSSIARLATTPATQQVGFDQLDHRVCRLETWPGLIDAT
jgi:hypothetical protein